MKLGQILVCAALCIASLSASACVSPPIRANAITKLESRRLQDEVVTRRTLDQLADVLQLTSGQRNTQPVNVLEYLPFALPARLAEQPGLCQKDMLFVSFDRGSEKSPDSGTPVRANGVETWSRFAIVPPSADDAACRSLADDKFFNAESEYDARTAAALLEKAVAQIRSGRDDFTMKCPEGKTACSDFFKSYDLGKIVSVHDCRQIDDPGQCWSYGDNYWGSVEIKTDYDAGRDTIISVKAVERLVLVHERID